MSVPCCLILCEVESWIVGWFTKSLWGEQVQVCTSSLIKVVLKVEVGYTDVLLHNNRKLCFPHFALDYQAKVYYQQISVSIANFSLFCVCVRLRHVLFKTCLEL